MTTKYLGIYLNDHLGGSTAGVELVARIAGQHAGDEIGAFASRLQHEIQEDRETLLEFMRTLGVSADRAKVAMGWLGEKMGRLKLNGELRSPSPLSPLVELEELDPRRPLRHERNVAPTPDGMASPGIPFDPRPGLREPAP